MDRGSKRASWILVAGLGQMVVEAFRQEDPCAPARRRKPSALGRCTWFVRKSEGAVVSSSVDENSLETGRLPQSEHDIEILYRRTGRTLPEIVEDSHEPRLLRAIVGENKYLQLVRILQHLRVQRLKRFGFFA